MVLSFDKTVDIFISKLPKSFKHGNRLESGSHLEFPVECSCELYVTKIAAVLSDLVYLLKVLFCTLTFTLKKANRLTAIN